MCSTYLSTPYGSGASAILSPGRRAAQGYIRRNQVESDHSYKRLSRRFRSATCVRPRIADGEVDNFAKMHRSCRPKYLRSSSTVCLSVCRTKLGRSAPSRK